MIERACSTRSAPPAAETGCATGTRPPPGTPPPGPAPPAAPPSGPLLADADLSAGEGVFTTNCASCHQASGEGVAGAFPPLVGHASELAVAEGGHEYLENLLLYGLQGEISALRGRADLLNAQVALATADRADLMERLDEVHAAEVAALARLRRLVTALPTPTCAPGAARVEAWRRTECYKLFQEVRGVLKISVPVPHSGSVGYDELFHVITLRVILALHLQSSGATRNDYLTAFSRT